MQKIEKILNEIMSYSDKYKSDVFKIADKIWEFAEVKFDTPKSANLICEYLESQGFKIERNSANIDYAFVASWGGSGPVVGYLAEYDALSGMGQPSQYYQEVTSEEPGHACGHNLLGTGVIHAALLIKDYCLNHGLDYQVKIYGCPAEESGYAKNIMAEAGVFNDATIILTWHPNAFTQAWVERTLAVKTVTISFTGIASHAAGAPEKGRSALDACELMNVGVNYLREHMPMEARIHYAYLNAGGTSANVVQKEAQLHYFIRGKNKNEVESLCNRVQDIAKGAALMTQTEMKFEVDASCRDLNASIPLSQTLETVMRSAKQIELDDSDKLHLEKYCHDPTNLYFDTQIRDARYHYQDYVSTDVGDVSWCVPTAQLFIACEPFDTPMHSWQWVDNGKSNVAHKGIIKAGEVLATTAIYVFQNKTLLQEIEEAFESEL